MTTTTNNAADAAHDAVMKAFREFMDSSIVSNDDDSKLDAYIAALADQRRLNALEAA